MFGPTGPTGPAGSVGPQGITGQYGIQGWRGFPGRPAKPVQLQILQCVSDVVAPSVTQMWDYPITAAIPALSANASTTISGLSISNILFPNFGGQFDGCNYSQITVPAGTYFFEAYAGIASNVYDATSNFVTAAGVCYLGLYDLCANSNIITGSITVAPNTAYLTGYLSNTTARNYSLRQNIVGVPTGDHGKAQAYKGGQYGPGTLISPQYFSNLYGPGPSNSPPNVTFTIMKIA